MRTAAGTGGREEPVGLQRGCAVAKGESELSSKELTFTKSTHLRQKTQTHFRVSGQTLVIHDTRCVSSLQNRACVETAA